VVVPRAGAAGGTDQTHTQGPFLSKMAPRDPHRRGVPHAGVRLTALDRLNKLPLAVHSRGGLHAGVHCSAMTNVTLCPAQLARSEPGP